MLCIIKKFRRLRVVCLPSMVLSAMACWRCQTTPLTISANHEGRPARGVAKKFPIDFRNVIAKSHPGPSLGESVTDSDTAGRGWMNALAVIR